MCFLVELFFLIDFYMKWPLVKHQFMYCRLIEQDQQWRLQNLTGLNRIKTNLIFSYENIIG